MKVLVAELNQVRRRTLSCSAPTSLASRVQAQHHFDAISQSRHIHDVATVTSGDSEWDDAKAAANHEKHGVTFEDGA